MVAVAIIAIALTAVLGSQSQSVSLASEAKFNTTASLLAQSKMAEMEMKRPEDLASESGDFGEDFPGYTWQVTLSPVSFGSPENVSDHLSQVEIEVSWGDDERYRYRIKQYLFVPKSD